MSSKQIFFIRVGAIIGSLIIAGCAETARDGTSSDLNAAEHLAGFLERVSKNKQSLDISIRPTKTGLITTCRGDEPEICDILAEACKALGGSGQCGGDENPTGCQCET